jgi:diazepam-binding inhibitor (GABA receptor modulating acyl-CoA-binding protein)
MNNNQITVLDVEFDKKCQQIKILKVRPTDNELLELYALFKQATVGDNNTECPSFFYMKDRAKWDAWTSKKGTNKQNAKYSYLKYADGILKKYQ